MKPPRPHAARVIARFVIAGVLLFAAQRALLPPDVARRALVVEVSQQATPGEVDAAVESAILLDVADRAGWARSDAVVRERLLRSLSVVEGVTDTNAAIDRGIAIGIHHQDPVARERLLANARFEMERDNDLVEPTSAELQEHVDAHSQRYMTPERVKFRHVFVSKHRRVPDLRIEAIGLLSYLLLDPEMPRASLDELSDPWPWTSDNVNYGVDRLDSLVGDEFGSTLADLPTGVWTGPVRSSFGIHLVFIVERVEPTMPYASHVAPRARAEILETRRQAYVSARLLSLRERYDVSIARQP